MLHRQNQTLAAMESCTGGLLASTITENEGASAIFAGGLVTYHTEQKIAAGVPPDIIEQFGVISSETAEAMAAAARERLNADYGIGITGVLGPDPVGGVAPGTVHIGIATPSGMRDSLMTAMNQGRPMVKRRAVTSALLLLRRTILAEGGA